MTDEVWKDVTGYENHYMVSNKGRVRALGGITVRKILPKYKNKDGYMFVVLTQNKNQKCYKVHRLVAQEFIPNPENKPQVNHKNGIKADNSVENLEWCTAKENSEHYHHILCGKPILPKKPKKQKKILQIIGQEIINEYDSIADAEWQTFISKQSISQCIRGRQKTAGGYKWQRVFLEN